VRFHTSPIFIPTEFSPFGERLFFTGCLLASLILIAHLWIFHRKDKLGRKLIWSALLMLPVLGWALYGAFYPPGDPPGSSE
jgi:hypothetical protein